MNLNYKKASWRAFGAALLGRTRVAAASFRFGAAATHPPAIRLGHACANPTKHGAIPGQQAPFTMTLRGTVDWSKLPTIAAKPNVSVAAKPIPTHLDALSPTQRATYLAGLKSGKIKAPFAPAQPLPTGMEKKPTVPSPNFDACGYFQLPCALYGFTGLTFSQSGDEYPPDQAIATNSSQVMEGVNGALGLYTIHGVTVYGPTSSGAFFASLVHSGASLGEPQMFWDASRQHFIIVEIEMVVSGGVTTDYLDIAVSKSQSGNLNPAIWNLYQSPTNVNNGGAADWCDYPTLGSDYWGMWISCVDFGSVSNGFVGNTVFAYNKTALYGGTSITPYYYNNIPIDIGTAFRLSPALEDGTPDAEFLVATDQGFGGPFNNLTTVAFTNTHGLVTGTAPSLSFVEQALPVSYTDGIPLSQAGTNVTLYPGYGTKQVEYKGGKLYLAMTTAVNSGVDDGVYWAEIQPQLSGLVPSNPGAQVVKTSLVRQDAIWAYSTGFDTFMPAFEGSDEDDEVLVFNYVSGVNGVAPGIVYTGRRATDPLNSMGDGGDSKPAAYGGFSNTSGRWGEYATCSLTLNLTTRGLIFCVGEFGGNDSQTFPNGWDSYVYGLQVE